MKRYVIRRLLQFLPVVIGATFIIFALVFAIPGDPIRALSGDRPLSDAVQETLRERYNLNDPLLIQYGKYMLGLLQGDFGTTFSGRPVNDIIVQRVPVSIRLAVSALVIQGVIGGLAGILAALRRQGFVDSLVQVSTTVLVAIPTLVLGMIGQVVFGLHLGWFPIAGIDQGWYSYILPGAMLASTSMALVARLLRTSLLENLRADYVRMATAKGLSRTRVVGRHALRNSLIPVVTFLGADLGTMLSGTVIIEGIFNLPGLGREVFRGIQQQEGTVVVGIVTLFVLVFVTLSLVIDLLYAYLDPRIRYD
ncbi:ABC transporter permease [Actinobacteria bacterium YIM 96077]|uniref:ABC transporter permease n=1 Tax=Phytoactinopolyspora halophila TaxID=1981511 RepID=A0A329QVG6_9ACTN|nr:ABC transporter permease [Phytoactinopolyspora halophila]AYY12793.1 ABC transporter permease [Actinobacteria bacterium YIM 96077]RAW16414.1 ABC transporter permease [Phytoactinopolyspora halophila]